MKPFAIFMIILVVIATSIRAFKMYKIDSNAKKMRKQKKIEQGKNKN